MATTQTTGIMSADWLNLLVGIAVFATPFMAAEYGAGPYWTSIVTGVVVFALAVWSMVAARAGRKSQAVGTNSIELIAGLVLVVLPFAVAANTTYRWLTVIEGLILIVASGYVAYALGKLRTAAGRARGM